MSRFPVSEPVYNACVNARGMNPSLEDLNLDVLTWLSAEEKNKIKEVMVREEEFTSNESGKLLKGKEMEGQLSKFTNLMKGWQNRWFVLDPEQGTLAYFLDKERVKQTPRGSVHLSGAVIAPSDEDSNLFTVNASNGDIYKLRAADGRSRQHWVNMMRAVTEYHSVGKPPIKTSSPANLQRSATVSANYRSKSSTPKLSRTATYSHGHHKMPFQPPPPKSASAPAAEELRNVKDAMNSVDEFHASVVETLENSPQSGEAAGSLDENVLIMKATSQAMVNVLHQCYTILQQQATDLQATAHSTGLPPGAHIEWLEPSQQENRTELRSKRSNREIDDVISEDEASDYTDAKEAEIEFTDIRQYENTEVIDTRDPEEESENMEPHRSMILSILSQLKLGMDLTRVVLPTFVLEKRSLLEMYADFFAHADLFARITEQSTAEERMFAVLEFYLTSFHVGRNSSVAKKPYNPIIGETFHCSYDIPQSSGDLASSNGATNSPTHSSHRVHYVAEQVSHHPPISAFYAECPHKNISMNAHIWTKSKFYGMSIGVVNVGEGIINVHDHDEEYVITFPNAYCRSILTYPWVELGGRTLIKCAKTGYAAVVLFHTKPFYGGTEHKVSAEIKHIPTGNICCRAEGSWDGNIEFSHVENESKNKSVDVNTLPVCLKRVRPLHYQSEFESRRLWSDVTMALKNNDLELATAAKHKLEERQRTEEKQRSASGIKWKTKLFHKIEDGWWYNGHAKQKRKIRTLSST